MRWLLREVRPLRDLGLTDDEWEAILHPGRAAAARRHGAGPRSTRAAAAPSPLWISIEEEGRRRGRRAYVPVELPGCAHAFHHRCISEWFGKKQTCPMCRGNVTKHLDPELSCRRISSCSAMTMVQIHIHIHTHPLCSIRQETRSRHLQASPERSCSNLHDAFMRTVRRCRTVLGFFVVTSVILQFVCADDKLVLARLWIC
jgi:hypothetical protein